MTDAERKKLEAAMTQILERVPTGLKTLQLCEEIKKKLDYDRLGIGYAAMLRYARDPKSDVYQPARGWFKHKRFEGAETEKVLSTKLKEQDFYAPFAKWLVEGPEGCTNAIPVGGAIFRDKFGTPDVIGVFRSEIDDMFKFPEEFTAAEIKIRRDLMTAFGQACSYKLFCHKSYIVVPEDAGSDLDRLDSLCLLLGIGLVVFNARSPKNPDFQIRTRALRHEPDMFYVNQRLKRVAKRLMEIPQALATGT